MKKLLLLLLLAVTPALADMTPAEDLPQDSRVKISVANPDRNVGFTVGDILERTVTLEVKKPYQLVKTSLPIVGYERRWKNQPTGIVLSRIGVDETSGGDTNRYVITLAYQIFTNNVVAKPATLPGEVIKFSAEGKQFDYRVPSWNFRISPIATYGQVIVEKDMSPFRGPFLMDDSRHQLALKACLAVFALSLVGLLYVLGVNTWLPRMGGPFAKAYRELRKLPADDEGLKKAVVRVHEALNKTAGSTVFNATGLLESKPGFLPVTAGLDQFFKLSRHVFFEPTAPHGLDQTPMAWLRQFCLACRNCERGMK